MPISPAFSEAVDRSFRGSLGLWTAGAAMIGYQAFLATRAEPTPIEDPQGVLVLWGMMITAGIIALAAPFVLIRKSRLAEKLAFPKTRDELADGFTGERLEERERLLSSMSPDEYRLFEVTGPAGLCCMVQLACTLMFALSASLPLEVYGSREGTLALLVVASGLLAWSFPRVRRLVQWAADSGTARLARA